MTKRELERRVVKAAMRAFNDYPVFEENDGVIRKGCPCPTCYEFQQACAALAKKKPAAGRGK